MSTYSIAEAKNQLSRLIDRALDGEAVIITRHGHPVIELKPLKAPKRPMTDAEIAWIEANRARPRGEGGDPVELLLRMRDEDWP